MRDESVLVLIMTIQVFDGFGAEKQQAVLLSEPGGGKGMTQESSRCPRFSEDLICLHNRVTNSSDPTGKYRGPLYPGVSKGKRAHFLSPKCSTWRAMHSLSATLCSNGEAGWHPFQSHCELSLLWKTP